MNKGPSINCVGSLGGGGLAKNLCLPTKGEGFQENLRRQLLKHFSQDYLEPFKPKNANCHTSL